VANSFDELLKMIQKIITDSNKFNVPRIGKVTQVVDPLNKGRVLVQIPSLGWNTDEKGAWCFPKQINGLIIPRVNDSVIVEFIDGSMDLPIYSGIAMNMKNMIPENYDPTGQSQLLYESADGKDFIKVDELLRELIINFSTGLGIKLSTGDSVNWQANVLALDPSTGVPHGGITAGIVKLKGG
jgi:hypothetical protein